MTTNLPDEVKNFIITFQKNGFQCYAVGGSVRDLLLNRPTRSWDFTTSATPEQIQKLFPESFYDNNFGTVGVKIKNSAGEIQDIYEITTFRKEGKYSDLRHPDQIEWAKTIEEDLARREFTISAIAITMSEKNDSFLIVDKYIGLEDLKNKLVKAIGNPSDRFQEDPLRLVRAIRIATQLGFNIEEKTWAAIVSNSGLITTISSERIRDELIKILSSEFPADGIQLLYNAGLLEYILPELTKGVGMKQPGHHIHDVFTHSLEALRHVKNPNWQVRFATLIHDIGKPITYKEKNSKPTFYNHEVAGAKIARDIANRLHFSKEDREKIYLLIRWHMFSVSEMITDAAIRRFIKRVGLGNTADMLDLRIGDRLGSGSRETSWRLEKFKERIIDVQKHTPSVKDLKVNGNDIMQTLGIPPGPKIGKILNLLFEEILEDPAKNEREYLIAQTKVLASRDHLS